MTRKWTLLVGSVAWVFGAWADAPVLTYNGATKGNWFDSGVWLNASGSATSWQDGAVAVITNKEITLNADAVVYGFNVYMTGRYCVYGTGKLTVGAGGITKNGSAGEFNIQNSGGLVLSESQLWNAPVSGMICLDGMRALTASNGVVLSGIGGTTSLRMNTAGGLAGNTTVYVSTNAYLSMSGSTSLSGGLVILDGPGNRLNADSGYTLGPSRLGGRLILRNGASMSLGACTLMLPTVEADAPATQAVSSVTGTSLALGCTTTEFAVSNAAIVQVSIPLNNVAGTNAAIRKTGAGELRLNAANTFSGGVAADAGVLRVMNVSGAGTGAVAVASGALLDLATAGVFSNLVTGAGAVAKTAAGSLTLPGVNAYSGGTLLSNGATRVTSAASLGSGAIALVNGASLVFSASQTIAGSDVARISGVGTVLAGTGTEVAWSGDYAVGSSLALDAEAGGTLAVGQLTGSGYTKAGAGTLRISGTTGYSGEIVVNAGVLAIGSTANLADGVTVRTTGNGVVQLDSLSGQDLAKITGTGAVALSAGTAVAVDTDSLTVTLTTVTNETWTISGLTGAADLVKTGPGTLVVSNAASFAGNVRVLQGTLRSVGAIGNHAVTVSNGVFAAYGAGTTLQNTFTVAGGMLLADAGGSLGTGSITLLSGGTLAATNSGSLGSGALPLSAGTLRMDAGGTAGTRAITTASGVLIQVYDGAGFDSAAMTLGGGTVSFLATTTMNCALPLTANTTISATSPAVGTLGGVVSGSKKLVVNGSGRIQMAGGGTAIGEIFVQSSGDFTIVSNLVTVTGYAGIESGGKRFAVADGGTFSMTGSGVNLHAGMGGGDCSFEVLTGGVYNVASGVNLMLGNGCNNFFRIRGGTVNVANGGQFVLGNSASITGTVELAAGGVLKSSRQFKTGPGYGAVIFSGGTLQSDCVNSYDPWIATNIAAVVTAAGGAVDTQGLGMRLGSVGVSGVGTMTLSGGGSLLFARPSTNWTGGLTLVQGAAIAASDCALGTVSVSLGTNTLLATTNACFLPNAIASAGGAIAVDAGVTCAVASVSGGLLVKSGSGGLLVDDAAEGLDASIRGGSLTVTPIGAMPARTPAANPAIWVDATVAASFVTLNSNDVSRWYDRRSPGDTNGFYASSLYNLPMITSNRVNGLPTLDFGVLGQGGGTGNNRMLVFKNYQAEIRTVFWVIGSKNGGGFLLGDSKVIGSARYFHRGSASGTYGGLPTDSLWHPTSEKGLVRNGETWTNGVSVNGTTTGLSGDYDLVTWRVSAADDATNGMAGACWFASCYADSGGRLNGGQELGEVLIYTNRLTDAEIKATERYLNRKWFPARYGSRIALDEVSLDGDGAGFVNAYTGPVQVAQLTVNATNVYVSGAAGGTSVSQAVVTAAGVLGPTVTAALALNHLAMQSESTLEAAFGAEGSAPVLALGGDLHLPTAARFVVTGSVNPPDTALLIDVAGSVTQEGGNTAWSNAGATSFASYVLVDETAKKVWLKTPSGTLLLVH